MKTVWFKKTDFLQTLFDAVPSLLFVVDDDVRLYGLNAAATKLLRTKQESLLMRKGGEILHCVHSQEDPGGCGRAPACGDCVIRRSVGKAFAGKGIQRETTKMEILSGDRIREVYFMITANPMQYRGKRFALLIMEDVTPQKKLEEALRRHTARLEAAYADMESFSYSASHDLRAPLRSIEGFSRILLQDYSDILDDAGKKYLDVINGDARKMARLIEDLLAFSRVSMSELSASEIDMEKIVREVFAELKKSFTGVVRIEVKDLPPAFGDSPMIRQVVMNLLSNALKFSSRNETALIEVGGAAEGKENTYYVKDNGIGFDPARADKLFEIFHRLGNAREFDGTGIGLTIVKRIVEKHGGRVRAKARPGKGATFYFVLPARSGRAIETSLHSGS